jgi:signal transduction histidine kinase/DNA-binding response OmpR family regulator
MMNEIGEQSFLKSVKGKILFGFLIGVGALAASYFITKGAFSRVEETISQISTPDEKLGMINVVFQDILLLNQIQNELQINPGRGNSRREVREGYIEHSDRLKARLDTLALWFADNPSQLARLDSIGEMLEKRKIAFDAYMLERRGMATSTALKKKVSSISEFIETSKDAKGDSTVVTTEKTTTTTTITNNVPQKSSNQEVDAEDSRKGLFNKIFKAKKSKEEVVDVAEPVVIKKEEVKVSIDTLTVARTDSAIQVVGEELKTIAQNQVVRANRFFERERQLQAGETLLIGQLMEVMRDVEADVLSNMYNDNEQIKRTIGRSIENIGFILLGVLTLTALLIFWISADLSQSSAYRKQLILAKEEADYHSAAKQRFLANMSHEIRTPLQSIIGFSELAKSQPHPSQGQLEIIHKSSEHLLYLVNEILDYSRIISDSFEFVDESFEIGQVLEEVVEILRPQAVTKGLELSLENQFPVPTFVSGDPFRMKQILHNLIGNAVKFTNQGGVRLLAEPVTTNGVREIRLEVRDTGIGMNAEQIKRIFNQFEQAHSGITPEYGGAGLGLSIVNALVTGQGGRIHVNSRLDEYSVFVIHLPRKDGTPVLKIEEVQEVEAEKLSFKGKTWVIDDDKYILSWVRTVLEQSGIQVASFSSPSDADRVPWDPEVRIVFIDMRMPEMAGPELCQRLRKKADPSVRFVACTAMALPDEAKHMLEMGFDEVLMKPFKKADILRVIQKVSRVAEGVKSDRDIAEGDEQRQQTEIPTRESRADLTGLLAMTMGDEQLLRDSLGQFVEDTVADLASINDYLQEPGGEVQLRELFHRLAGRIGQVGASELGGRMRELELMFMRGEPTPREEVERAVADGYELVEEIQEKYVS